MIVNCESMDGLKVGENAYDDIDCDPLLCFGNQILSWTNILFSIISQDNAVTLGEVSAFVSGCNGNGYSFFCYGNNSKFHVNLIDFPEHVYDIHPKQDRRSFEEYLNLILFHYSMVAFKLDYKKVFN